MPARARPCSAHRCPHAALRHLWVAAPTSGRQGYWCAEAPRTPAVHMGSVALRRVPKTLGPTLWHQATCLTPDSPSGLGITFTFMITSNFHKATVPILHKDSGSREMRWLRSPALSSRSSCPARVPAGMRHCWKDQ